MKIKLYDFKPYEPYINPDYKNQTPFLNSPQMEYEIKIDPIDYNNKYAYLYITVIFTFQEKNSVFSRTKFKIFFHVELFDYSDTATYRNELFQFISKAFEDIKEYLVKNIPMEIDNKQGALISPSEKLSLSNELFEEILKQEDQ